MKKFVQAHGGGQFFKCGRDRVQAGGYPSTERLSCLFQCPAIDYTRHTLDGAACLLNSNKYFPSRVSIKESSVAKLGSVCRRVYRIFSHAYFHHRSLFDEYEVSSTAASTE